MKTCKCGTITAQTYISDGVLISEYGVKCKFDFGDRVLVYVKRFDERVGKWVKGRFVTFNKYNQRPFWVLVDNAPTVDAFEKCIPYQEKQP